MDITPLGIAGTALGIASIALQLLKSSNNKQRESTRGELLGQLERRVTDCCRKEREVLEERIRSRVHDLADTVTKQSIQAENNRSNIESLWREVDRRRKPRN